MTNNSATCWHRLSPQFINSILEIIPQNEADYRGVSIFGLDIAELLLSGCIEHFTVRDGKLLAELDETSLIATGHFGELAQCLKEGWADTILSYYIEPIYEYCFGDHDIALEMITDRLAEDPEEADAAYILLLINRYDKRRAANKYIFELDDLTSAKINRLIFHDNAKSHALLDAYMLDINNDVDREELLTHHLTLFNSVDTARRLLQNIEQNATLPTDYCRCANIYFKYFGEEHEAKRCLNVAEDIAETLEERSTCARSRIFLSSSETLEANVKRYSDLSKRIATRDTQEAEATSKYHKELYKRHKLDDFMRLKRRANWNMPASFINKCIARFESRIQKTYEALFCAELSIDVLDDSQRAKQFLVKAQELAKEPYDMILCAQFWREQLNSSKKARHCLLAAEKMTNSSLDWRICTRCWIDILKASSEAKRCLNQAHLAAKTQFDKIACEILLAV